MTPEELKAVSLLPEKIRFAITRQIQTHPAPLDEIRLRYGHSPCITSGENTIICPDTACDKRELTETVTAFSGGAVYPYSDSIRNGFISTAEGIRVGLVGRANGENGEILSVYDINAINIRIPHRVKNAGNIIQEIFSSNKNITGIIVYSPPGVGKTTMLREFLYESATYKTAAVDTRYELCPGGISGSSVDVLSGYPRALGIEIAVRCMSPDIIVCDEIASEEDAIAIRNAHFAGVKVVATAHASDLESLMKKKAIAGLIESGITEATVGICRTARGYTYDVKFSEKGESNDI